MGLFKETNITQLTSAKFDVNKTNASGIYKCGNGQCKICRLYLVECNTFKTSNNSIWEVRSRISCSSKMVIYYQICVFCTKVTNIGKTNNLRLRTNNHISACRSGNSTDQFDNHVHACMKKINVQNEPYFKLMVFMELNDVNKLLVYENYLHKQGHDTINRTTAKGNK